MMTRPTACSRRRSEGSVTRKGRKWYAILTVGRDDKGRQLRQWSKGFKTRREAERILAQLLIEGRTTKEARSLVQTVVQEYVDRDMTPHGRRSPTTTQRYLGLLANIKPIAGERVDRLSGSAIESFYMLLLEKGLSPTTVHHVHNLLYASFRWAKSKRIALITRNPFETEDIRKPRRSKSTVESLTVEQARAALVELACTKHVNALVFALATGCRRGEVCGLKWSAIDLTRKVVTIRESRYQVRGEMGQKTTKAGRIREVPLNKMAIQALLAERSRQEQRRRIAADAWVESGHVFANELGVPLSPMTLTNAFGRCARKASLPTTRMHALRHTAATFILSAGGNPVAATQILGHSEIGTTLRLYGHVIGLDSARAVRQIERALATKPERS